MSTPTVPEDSPLGVLLLAAADALAAHDGQALEAAYEEAVEWTRVHPESGISTVALALDGVVDLLAAGHPTRATAVATRHLAEPDLSGSEVRWLLLRRAEARLVLRDVVGCRQDLDLAEEHSPDEAGLAAGQDRVRDRLRALLQAQAGDVRGALTALQQVRSAFEGRGDAAAVRTLTRDIARVSLDDGRPVESVEVPEGDSAADVVLAARLQRRAGEYEAAADRLTALLRRPLDPGLEFPVLHERLLLLDLLGLVPADERDALLDRLEGLAAGAADSRSALAAVRRLRDRGGTAEDEDEDEDEESFDGALARVHRLAAVGALPEAEALLARLDTRRPTGRRAARLHVVAGEVLLAAAKARGSPGYARRAASRLAIARDVAETCSLPEVQTRALWHLGHARRLTGGLLEARPSWAEAQRLEERLAASQVTDDARLRALRAASTEMDEIIAVAAARVERGSEREAGTFVAAMEAARGATVLPAILPGQAESLRDLPLESTPQAWEWLQRLLLPLGRDSALWFVHAGPRHVHHALCTPGSVAVTRVPLPRADLEALVDGLAGLWRDAGWVMQALHSPQDPLRTKLRRLARLLDVDAVLGRTDPSVRRLAVVAGGALGDVPVAALPLAGAPLVTRFAVSDLPCLSASEPLRRRGRQQLGLGRLLVQPEAGLLAESSRRARRGRVLSGADATVTAVARELARGRARLVRFDCHGEFEREGRDLRGSRLRLQPAAGDDGDLRARDLERLGLQRTGTLVLGACETGMSHRVGRDERVGFVRSGLLAGSASVVAARWVAEDVASVTILDDLERGLRWLPRDLALRRAQLRWMTGRASPSSAHDPGHPAWWACWSLYGDRGHQTRVPAAWRRLRRPLA